jgi:hypothetical protein
VIVHIMTYERSTLVNSEKYIGLDVHQATISVAVMDPRGKLVMESILETKATTIFGALRGTARDFVGNVRRRNLGCLALRSAQAACCQVSGVQPAQERSAQTRWLDNFGLVPAVRVVEVTQYDLLGCQGCCCIERTMRLLDGLS